MLDGHVHEVAELDVGHGARLRRGAVEAREWLKGSRGWTAGRGVGAIAGALSGELSADGVRSSLRRRSLDESEHFADACAEEILSDGGDIGDDEIFQVSADVR